MKMSEDERQCLSESRGGSANVISIFSYCARRYSKESARQIALSKTSRNSEFALVFKYEPE